MPYWLEPSHLIVGPSKNGCILTDRKTTKVIETFLVQITSSQFFQGFALHFGAGPVRSRLIYFQISVVNI